MTTNTYFNLSTNNANEQAIVDGFVTESIQMFGRDINYLPRTLQKEDLLFQEDVISQFLSNFVIEAYIENIDAFDGDGDLLGKFGLQVGDEMSLQLSKSRFITEGAVASLAAPRVGDLVYLPWADLARNTWEINFVETEEQFHPLGSNPSFKLRCKLFDFSQEQLSTGIAALDSIPAAIATNNPVADNTAIQTEGATTVIFDVNNPFGGV